MKSPKRFRTELAPPPLAERLECGGLPPLWDKTKPGEIVCPACEDARPTSPLPFELPICNLAAASCRPVAALYERRGSPRRSQTAATEKTNFGDSHGGRLQRPSLRASRTWQDLHPAQAAREDARPTSPLHCHAPVAACAEYPPYQRQGAAANFQFPNANLKLSSMPCAGASGLKARQIIAQGWSPSRSGEERLPWVNRSHYRYLPPARGKVAAGRMGILADSHQSLSPAREDARHTSPLHCHAPVAACAERPPYQSRKSVLIGVNPCHLLAPTETSTLQNLDRC